MQAFPKYESYKDSGVEWLGKIPSHWDVCRNMGLFDERKEVNCPDMELLSVTIDRGVIQQSDITAKKDSSNEDKSKYKVVRKGDLAYNKMRMWQGAIGMSDFDGIVSPAYIILNARNTAYSRYFHYLYRTELFIKEADRYSYGLCSDMNSLRYEDFKTIFSPVPPQKDVERITNFLDKKTSEIDEAIAKKQQLIELLKEQKAILINQAVTKGLNPNVPMRDSGVEWIGDIPANWKVKNFKYCCKVTSGQVNPKKEPYASLVLIAPNHIESGTGKLIQTETAKDQGADSGKYLVSAGDIVYSKIRPALRKVCISPVDGLCSADMYVLKPFNELNKKYLLNFILTDAFTLSALDAAMRVAMPKVNREALGTFPILIPKIQEQIDIVLFIEKRKQELDHIINSVVNEIEALNEFKQIIISEAVTGKIKI
ncbi:MAG: restriction endonuclease subunit S [Pseudomonadota bacterium]